MVKVTATAVADSSSDSYWETEASTLPPARTGEEPPPDDDTGWVNPPENACPVCGFEVVKQPGQKRRPKYHAQCKPTRGKAASGPRPVRVTSQERQAAEQVEMALDRLRAALTKAVLGLSMFDPYDALVLRINSEELVENCRPLLMRFPALREGAANATAGASILGLVFTLLSIGLPIMAHHNLIPMKKFVPMLLNLPFLLMKMQERMASESDGTLEEDLVARVEMEQRKKKEAQMRAAGVETVNASPTR